jgi:hypothetical protein
MGDTNNVNNDWEDPDNLGFPLHPALGTLRNDMGAYGGNQYKSMPYMQMDDLVSGIEDENGTIANKFSLNQNYPNPFNPSTKIEFYLPKSEYAELKVYNILGKQVSTLVSNKLNQGSHTYQFDGKNLASGIYYYQLVSGELMEVKKMILLR